MDNQVNRLYSLLTVIVCTFLVLVFFLNKAFHIDDTLFLQTARHIIKNPANFYGFSTNWYGFTMPMSKVNQNPPLVSYYLALFIRFFGEKEVVLHSALLLPAIGLTTGVYLLGNFYCRNALAAALFVICSPVFVVSGSNVMSDTLMICFYVWAILLWLYGLQENKILFAFLSGLCVALAFLTKYFGITAALLLFVYTLHRKRGLHSSLFALLLPVAVVIAFHLYSGNLYGKSLFSNAAFYSLTSSLKGGVGNLEFKTLVGLSFTGGCLLPILFFSPFLARGKKAYLVCFTVLLAVSLLLLSTVPRSRLALQLPGGSLRWGIIVQLAVAVATGLLVLFVAWTDMASERTPESFLLFFWVIGTFFFVTYLNWTINARTIFPMAPAVALLVIRRIERFSPQHVFSWMKFSPLLPAVLIALLIGQADYALANAQRTAARKITDEYRQPGRTIWFEGHWGFQYYMEKAGAKAIDYRKTHPTQGDLLVIPTNNSNIMYPSSSSPFVALKRYRIALPAIAATMDALPGQAGFYADIWGVLPFTFGRPTPEEYDVFVYK